MKRLFLILIALAALIPLMLEDPDTGSDPNIRAFEAAKTESGVDTIGASTVRSTQSPTQSTADPEPAPVKISAPEKATRTRETRTYRITLTLDGQPIPRSRSNTPAVYVAAQGSSGKFDDFESVFANTTTVKFYKRPEPRGDDLSDVDLIVEDNVERIRFFTMTSEKHEIHVDELHDGLVIDLKTAAGIRVTFKPDRKPDMEDPTYWVGVYRRDNETREHLEGRFKHDNPVFTEIREEGVYLVKVSVWDGNAGFSLNLGDIRIVDGMEIPLTIPALTTVRVNVRDLSRESGNRFVLQYVDSVTGEYTENFLKPDDKGNDVTVRLTVKDGTELRAFCLDHSAFIYDRPDDGPRGEHLLGWAFKTAILPGEQLLVMKRATSEQVKSLGSRVMDDKTYKEIGNWN